MVALFFGVKITLENRTTVKSVKLYACNKNLQICDTFYSPNILIFDESYSPILYEQK